MSPGTSVRPKSVGGAFPNRIPSSTTTSSNRQRRSSSANGSRESIGSGVTRSSGYDLFGSLYAVRSNVYVVMYIHLYSPYLMVMQARHSHQNSLKASGNKYALDATSFSHTPDIGASQYRSSSFPMLSGGGSLDSSRG